MRHLGIGAAMLAAVLVGTGSTAGCDPTNCGDISCGPGLTVYWAPDEFPSAATFQVCVNNVPCQDPVVVRRMGDRSEWLGLQAHISVSVEHPIRVRLQRTDLGKAPVTIATGGGEQHGKCCPNFQLRVEDRKLNDDPI